MNFLNPLGFAAFLAVPAIITMYILKEKHKTENISSIFLWEKAIANAKAHEPWQKLKKNILMVLQIFIACLISLALAKPYISGASEGKKYIFVLDSSLSMQSTDKKPTRFEFAKNQIKSIIKDAPDNGEFSVIVMGSSPYVIVSGTNYKGELISSIDNLKCENSTASVEEAVALVDLELSQNNGNVYVFTDNNYDFSNQNGNVISLGESNDNMGIVSINHTKNENSVDLLVKVKNFSNDEIENTVTVYTDDNIFDIIDFKIGAGEIKDIYFQKIPLNCRQVVAKLSNEDILKNDNISYHIIEEGTTKKVLLVSSQNVFLEKIFQIIDNVELYKTQIDNTEKLTGYELYVFDGVLPEIMPTDGHILIFNPPEGNSFIETTAQNEGGIAYSLNDNILNDGLNINFVISYMKNIKLPSWASSVIETENGTAFFYGEKDTAKIAVFSFDIHDSDFPLKKEFPIFIYNLMNYIFPVSLNSGENIKAGAKVQFNFLPESTSISVESPEGKMISLAPPFPPSTYEGTYETGFYKLIQSGKDGKTKEDYFAVNCDTLSEGGFSASKAENISDEGSYKRNINRDMRNAFLVIALIVLAFEWRVNCRDN